MADAGSIASHATPGLPTQGSKSDQKNPKTNFSKNLQQTGGNGAVKTGKEPGLSSMNQSETMNEIFILFWRLRLQ